MPSENKLADLLIIKAADSAAFFISTRIESDQIHTHGCACPGQIIDNRKCICFNSFHGELIYLVTRPFTHTFQEKNNERHGSGRMQ